MTLDEKIERLSFMFQQQQEVLKSIAEVVFYAKDSPEEKLHQIDKILKNLMFSDKVN